MSVKAAPILELVPILFKARIKSSTDCSLKSISLHALSNNWIFCLAISAL